MVGQHVHTLLANPPLVAVREGVNGPRTDNPRGDCNNDNELRGDCNNDNEDDDDRDAPFTITAEEVEVGG